MPAQEARLPFREQIAFFKAKTGVPTATWRDVWKAGHDRSFMVAGAIKADLVEDFRTAIEEAISEGTGYAAFREKFDDIVERHGWSYNGSPGWRSRTIYKTNMETSYQAGRFKQMKDIADRRPYWIYRHSDFVADPRPHHLAWDGDVRRHDDPWWDIHYPPNGWGCFPGWLPVRCDARLGLKTRYAGKMVELRTRGGHGFTATANHPVLTRRGWLAAHEVEEGDELIGARGNEDAVARGVVENQQTPSRAEDLFEALASEGLRVAPVSPHDFHGDAHLRETEIHVAGSDRALVDVIQAARGELVGEGGLYGALHGRVESADVAARPAQAASVVQNAVAPEDPPDRGLRQAEPAGNLGLTEQAAAVKGQRLALDAVVAGVSGPPRGGQQRAGLAPGLHSHPAPPGRVTAAAPGDPAPLEDAAERVAADAELFGQLLERNPGLVAADEVFFVRQFDWQGHVYDFTTETGLIIAGGLVVRNCKCRAFSISRTELERRGLTPKTDDPDGGAVDPATGEAPGIDEGWGYTPGRSVAEDLRRIVQQKARRLRPPVRGQFQAAAADTPEPPAAPTGAALIDPAKLAALLNAVDDEDLSE